MADLLQIQTYKPDDGGKIAVPTGAGIGVALIDEFLEQGAD